MSTVGHLLEGRDSRGKHYLETEMSKARYCTSDGNNTLFAKFQNESASNSSPGFAVYAQILSTKKESVDNHESKYSLT